MRVPPIQLPPGSEGLLEGIFWLLLVAGVFVAAWAICSIVTYLILFAGREESGRDTGLAVSVWIGLAINIGLYIWKGSLAMAAVGWIMANIVIIILVFVALGILGAIGEKVFA